MVKLVVTSAITRTLACLFALSHPVHAQPLPEPALPPAHDEPRPLGGSDPEPLGISDKDFGRSKQPSDRTCAPKCPKQAVGSGSSGSGSPPRPWATGVSENAQATALELYVAGNHEFTESHFAQALVKYKEAIRHWDHPAIRYNMAVALIYLDQPVEARDNLERSLIHGTTPLGGDMYKQALVYRKLLDAQLTHVEIRCQEPGAEVTLDGKLLFTGPGMADQFLLPGEHQVVATKIGFLTAFKTFVGVAGKPTVHDIRPTLEIKATPKMVRRWEPWKPWTVLATGGALSGLGALSYAAAAHNFSAYDDGIMMQCPSGCDAATLARLTDLRQRKDRARLQQEVAFSLFAVGSAATIAGVVGLIINQPRMHFEPNHAQPIVASTAGGAMISMIWGF